MTSVTGLFSRLAFLTCLCCAAQQDPNSSQAISPEIRGTVVEFGTTRGIEGVEVSVERFGDEAPRIFSSLSCFS